MSHRVAAKAEAELDEIWHYIAIRSGSMELADRFINSLTDHFIWLQRIRISDAAGMTIYAPDCAAS